MSSPSISFSSTNPHHSQYPQFPETSQIDSGYTQTDEILDNLTKQMALLTQSFRATLPQTNNQFRASSNTQNQATIQDGQVKENRSSVITIIGLDHIVRNSTSAEASSEFPDLFQGQNAAEQAQRMTIFMANLSLVGSANPQAGPSNASILSEVAIYEQRAKFELTEREQRMDDQMCMLIQNRNKTEENLKKELHSFKLQLKSTMENNKIIEEMVTTLKQEFKHKESKFLTDFSNLKHLNDKLENKLHSQDQSIQTVHMRSSKTKGRRAKGQCNTPTVLPPATVYPSQYTGPSGIQKSLVTEVRAMKAVFENLEAEVDQNETDLRSGEIERKNLLITNENLVAECVSKDVFYTATDSVLNVSRFSDMHDAFTSAQKRRGNKIRELKEKISRLTKKNSDIDPTCDLKALVSQNNDLTAKLNALQDLNECFRAENAKVKQHYKELYDSIKITRVVKVVPQQLCQWRPTGRLLPLGDQWPLTRNTPPKVLPTKQWKPTGRLLLLGRQCPLVRSTALKSNYLPADPHETITPVVQIVLCYLESGCSKHMTGDRSRLRNFVKKFIRTVRFRNDHFGAIMGYGDYVIGDSVISRVYYVEGLGHNLFSVGQFCDSDLEVAFRKHTCFVRDLDGVDLIKGSRGTNLYTIFVEDMMRSSPLLTYLKLPKNKSGYGIIA
ncbi:hypothetical protein Tco_0223075 [Tanacetum coccineum]